MENLMVEVNMNVGWILHCHVLEDWKKQLHMIEYSIHVGAQYFLRMLEVLYWVMFKIK